MTCGCGEPNDTHGDNANITNEEIVHAADAAGISEQEAIDNIIKTYQEKVAKAA